jgi:hypothetical protein
MGTDLPRGAESRLPHLVQGPQEGPGAVWSYAARCDQPRDGVERLLLPAADGAREGRSGQLAGTLAHERKRPLLQLPGIRCILRAFVENLEIEAAILAIDDSKGSWRLLSTAHSGLCV